MDHCFRVLKLLALLIWSYPATILCQTPDTILFGGDVGRLFGTSVAGGKDVDGDNVPDFVVGSPGYDSGRGRVVVYSGATRQVIMTFLGDLADSYFGIRVGLLGDLNNDSRAEVIASATGSQGCPPSSSSPAYVRVYYGGTGSAAYTISGSSTDHFGYALSVIGDATGDGYDDFVVGSHDALRQTSNPCSISKGRVQLFSGLSGSALYTVNGTVFGGDLGKTLGAIGDVSGDAIPDVVVGGTNLQSIQVYSGANLASLYSLSTGTGNSGPSTFSPLGDMNGDGRTDFLVGATNQGSSVQGQVYIISGLNGSTLSTLTGATSLGAFGNSVLGIPDLNGDNVPDFLVGEVGPATGTNHFNSSVYVYSGQSLTTLNRIVGSGTTSDRFGEALAVIGDLTGDGKPEFAVGAPADRLFHNSEGSVRVYREALGPDTAASYWNLLGDVVVSF